MIKTRNRRVTKRLSLFLVSIAFAASNMMAANTIRSLEQVTTNQTLSENVDLTITSSTPFAPGVTVNITNTDHAVIIFSALKPSEALNQLSHIKINNSTAANGINCQVKIYGNGSMVLPTPEGFHPLIVFTGLNETGDSQTFDAGNRQTLLNKPINNRIRSFILKRGFMVCFATKYDGYGYSRIFIADKDDKVINLPGILQNSISSIRVSKWNDTSKKGYAGNDVTANTLLNTTWCYNWDAGVNVWDDREYVTQHHHEGWPGIADVGNNGTSANILGNNEPENTSDSREQQATVDQVLANWPTMMATGRRLGSPAVSGNYSWLYAFIDSIDKRGWRCDYIAVHAYRYSDWGDWQSFLSGIHNRTGRPIWITEMNYGANWTGWPGSDTSGSEANYAIEKQHFAPTIDGLESTPWIERYAAYNWVEDCRKLYNETNSTLTPMGQYYADKSSAIAYNSKYEFVPKVPSSKGKPDNTKISFDNNTGTATLSWKEYNGEYNTSMTVERRGPDNQWVTIDTIPLQEEAASYTYTDSNAVNGYSYRIHIVNASGYDEYSAVVKVVASDIKAGNSITINGKEYYAGGNVFTNGDFDLGTTGWINGEGNPIGAPYFEVIPRGGSDGCSYLQAFTHQGMDKAGALKTTFDIDANSEYYFSASFKFDVSGLVYSRLSLSSTGVAEDTIVGRMSGTPEWSGFNSTFNSGKYTKILLSCRWLESKAQIDKLQLFRLFDNEADAVADGIKLLKRRGDTFIAYNTKYPEINTKLNSALTTATGNDKETLNIIQNAIDNAVNDFKKKAVVDSLVNTAGIAIRYKIPGYEDLISEISKVKGAYTLGLYTESEAALRKTMDRVMPMTTVSDKIQSYKFDGVIPTGWTVNGNYTGGIQAQSTEDNVTTWKAFWSDASLSATSTMGITQKVADLPHGLYSLQCQASTDHYCITDQHAYIKTADGTAEVSPSLSIDAKDIPAANYWETLTTTPVYVDDKDTITIGFIGSKANALTDAWREYGNNNSTDDGREGSWWATSFVLRYHPLYKRTSEQPEWNTICLPYAFTPSEGVHLYKIAGITKDQTKICIEPVTETEAGICYIYQTDSTDITFYEYGNPVSSAVSTSEGLRGFFERYGTTKVSVNAYSLTRDGFWLKATSDNRPIVGSYTAFLRMNIEDLTVLDNWTGETMPIGDATGINTIGKNDTGHDMIEYSIGGIRTNKGHGIRILVKDGKAKKVVK